jgi:nitrogen fixation NifU-like protein
MTPYGGIIQEHFRNPRNYGSLDAPDFRHEEVNPFCGDRVRIELAFAGDRTVRAARFQGDLCMIAKAATSLLTEMLAGMSIEQLTELPDRRLLDALDATIPAARMQCALLPLQALRNGLGEKTTPHPPAAPSPLTRGEGSSN